jgi:hypothetical protein
VGRKVGAIRKKKKKIYIYIYIPAGAMALIGLEMHPPLENNRFIILIRKIMRLAHKAVSSVEK